MVGLIYLSILWSIWICATFLMKKNNPLRWWIALVTLILIIVKPITLSFFQLTMTGPALVLLGLSYFISARLSFGKQINFVISVIVMMLGFSGLLFFELYDPVWVFIDRQILFSFLLFIGSYLIYPSSFILRMTVACLGSIQAEILFAISISQWKMNYLIGSMEYLDILTITCMSLALLHYLSKLTTLFKINKEKRMLQ